MHEKIRFDFQVKPLFPSRLDHFKQGKIHWQFIDLQTQQEKPLHFCLRTSLSNSPILYFLIKAERENTILCFHFPIN